jgi:hypothetical protein
MTRPLPPVRSFLRHAALVLATAAALAALTGPVPAAAQVDSTRVVVRAVAHDAKLVQSPVGGAQIRIADAETGEVLAEGIQRGDSGSTEAIMRQPHERHASIYDTEGAAHFDTTLALERPRRVTVTARGPLDYPDAMQSASITTTLLPGHHVEGDGLVLSLHGFIVEPLTDPSALTPGRTVDVRSRVRMMCGCPTEPGGLWDSNRFTIRAQALGPDGDVLASAPLSFAGTTSEYSGSLSLPDAANRVRITAVDDTGTNAGQAVVETTAP